MIITKKSNNIITKVMIITRLKVISTLIYFIIITSALTLQQSILPRGHLSLQRHLLNYLGTQAEWICFNNVYCKQNSPKHEVEHAQERRSYQMKGLSEILYVTAEGFQQNCFFISMYLFSLLFLVLFLYFFTFFSLCLVIYIIFFQCRRTNLREITSWEMSEKTLQYLPARFHLLLSHF